MVGVEQSQETEFESLFKRLEQTVETLEKGGLSLSQATVLFEEGMRLAKLCNERLDKAELRITELQNTFNHGADESTQ